MDTGIFFAGKCKMAGKSW